MKKFLKSTKKDGLISGKKKKKRTMVKEDISIKKEETISENNKMKKQSSKVFIKRLNSIRTKLISAFLVPVILIIILGVLSYSKSSKGLIESYESSTLTTMSFMAKYLNFGLDIVAQKADTMTVNKDIIYYYSGLYKKDEKDEKERFSEIQTSVSKEIIAQDYISNAYVFSIYGTGFSGSGIAASKMGYDDFIAGNEGALLSTDQSEGIWVGKNPYIDELTKTKSSNYALSYMKKMYSILMQPVGCIVLNVSYGYIEDTISESGFPKGSVVAFVTSDEKEIISGDVPEGFNLVEQSYYQNAIANQELVEGSQYIKFKGNDYLFIYSKLKTSQSVLCTLIPRSLIVAKANDVKNITLLMIIMASIIAISLGTYIANGFSTTIQKVNKVLHKTESGDLTCYSQIKRKDEFQVLGKSINDLIDGMQKLIRKMTGTSNTVSHSATTVAESSTILVSATKNISDAINDIENGVSQQAVDAENCLHQMADLAEKINKLYIGTHNIEQIAGNTEKIVSNGMDIVDNLSMKVKDTTEVTRTVIRDIENLVQESKAISGIIDFMNGITEQTNLLSLNASIEAARAGEFGRGFSVVATEMRKLADQSLKASNEIAKIINKIEEQTKKTVKTAKCAENIVLSQVDALSSTINVFTEINKHVENLTDNLNQIAIGVEGIEHTKDDTLRSIESISATTQETAAATEELSVIGVNQLQEVNKLNDVVQQLNNDAGSLAESVSVFKIN
ncbi:MAG: methyl-accepting chemotaxis protein [Mobilitalea sp.]